MKVNLPQMKFVDSDGNVNRAWRDYLLNPTVFTFASAKAIDPTSGGTGLATVPAAGQVLIGGTASAYALVNSLPSTSGGTGLTSGPGADQLLVGAHSGTGYALVTTLPTPAFPALTGDLTTVAGSLATTLATVNTTPGGPFGSGSSTSTVTVNGKGLVTASADMPITGAQSMLVAGAFGCNGKTIQTSATVSVAVAGTAGTTYTAAEQGLLNSVVALANQLRAALVANGVVA